MSLNLFDPQVSIAADFGAGSGRWSVRMLDFFSKIYVIEPSIGAIEVLNQRFKNNEKIVILKETISLNSVPDQSLDLAFSIGVLHHIQDTPSAIKQISSKIKSGGYFLCYLYYKLDEKPIVYRLLFFSSNLLRMLISKLPYNLKKLICSFLAAVIYLPLARTSKLLKFFGFKVSNFPLHHYSDLSFEMMANDSLDRFGTRLERRFNKSEIIEMLSKANFDLDTIKFSDEEPFWTFSVMKL